MTKLLSIGNNQKLDKSIAVFNLPLGITCPGHTAFCEKVCYAKKAERIYKGARDMRARNLIAAKRPDFKAVMIAELKQLKNVKLLRHCEAGDFFDQTYLDNWFDIAREFPGITFLAYTKSFMLDFKNKPDNFQIIFSVDKTTTLKVPVTGWARFAYTVSKGEAVPVMYKHTCNKKIKQNGKVVEMDKHYCGAACRKCWNKGISHIFFSQH